LSFTGVTRGVIVLAGGTAAGQIISIIAMPIITRLYTPKDFGILSIYLSVLTILAAVISLRYELAIPLPKRDHIARQVVRLGFIIVMLSTIIVILVGFLFEKTFITFFQLDELLMEYLWLLPLSFLAIGLYNLLSYWAIRKKEYHLIAKTKLSQSVSGVTTHITMGYLQSGAFGLIIGSIVGQVVGIFSLFLFFKKSIPKKKSKIAIKIKRIFAVAVKYRQFPQFSMPAGLMSATGQSAPALLLAEFYGLEIAGYFLLANKVIGAPLQMIGSSISQVYYAEAAQIVRTKPSHLKRLFLSLTKKLFYFSLLLSLILILTGKWVFLLVFGEEWEIAGIYVSILALMFFARFITNPLAVTFSILEKQRLTLLIQIIIIISSVGSLLIAPALDLSHAEAIMLYSFTMFVAYGSIFFILFRTIMN